MEHLLDLLTKLIGALGAALAVATALLSVTRGGRLRRAMTFYREAADDEASRSPARSAVLRSLQREALGKIVAQRAVPRRELLWPIAGFLVWLSLLFVQGQALGQNLAAGAGWDLSNPDGPVLSGAFILLLGGLILWGFGGPLIRSYFEEQRRIARAYESGEATLSHTRWLGAFKSRPTRESCLHALVLLGTSSYAVLTGVTVGGDLVGLQRANPLGAICLLLGSAALALTLKFTDPPMLREWKHPLSIEQTPAEQTPAEQTPPDKS